MEDFEDSAMDKFWKTPVVLEVLVLHLDPSSLLSLTEVVPDVLKVIEGVSVWGNLIRRSFINSIDYSEHQKTNISNLGKILSKMNNKKKKEGLELDLLHLIAARCSTAPGEWNNVKVSCPCNTTHSVSEFGFLLMEEVEFAVGSAVQNVEEIATAMLANVGSMWPTFSALGSRMQRQQQLIRVWKMDSLYCGSMAGAKTANILLRKTMRINWGGDSGVHVRAEIGEEGWTALAAGLQQHPGFGEVSAPRGSMLQAPKATIKILWDAMGAGNARWQVLTDDLAGDIEVVKDGVTDELKWAEISEILDMSESQFLADNRMYWYAEPVYESEGDEESVGEGVEEQVWDMLEEG